MIAWILLIFVLIYVSFVDIREKKVYDHSILAILLIALLRSFFYGININLYASILLFVIFASTYIGFKALYGNEYLGIGDIKLISFLGLFLQSIYSVPAFVFLCGLLGLVIHLLFYNKKVIPFAPVIAVAFLSISGLEFFGYLH